MAVTRFRMCKPRQVIGHSKIWQFCVAMAGARKMAVTAICCLAHR